MVLPDRLNSCTAQHTDSCRMESQEVDQDEVQEGQVEVETKNPGAARFGNFINYYQFNPPSGGATLYKTVLALVYVHYINR